MSEQRSCVVEAMIRGSHEYQSIWEAEIGENLACIRDPYDVAVTKPESSRHVPRKMSAICSLFLRKHTSGVMKIRLFLLRKIQSRLVPR